jgi:glyoxylase-like metal-dependent hydrolase (beta-lactamase superfamily II)
MNLRVHYLNGGYCRHLLASVDGRTCKVVRFYAVFLAIEHPRLGWVVCDTGYGARFFEATRGWPQRLYRWATPVTLRGTAAVALRKLGVRPEEVEHVIVTHFHADHIGGLREFTRAKFYHHAGALAPLLACGSFKQTRAAFLPGLMPEDFAERSVGVKAEAFAESGELPFKAYDIFGDGSVRLVELPGHAPGQVGLEYEDDAGRTLYCADAFWRKEQIERGVNLPRLTRGLQWDGAAYGATIGKLRELAGRKTHRLLACHDEETQRYVADQG